MNLLSNTWLMTLEDKEAKKQILNNVARDIEVNRGEDTSITPTGSDAWDFRSPAIPAYY